jgi:hypothetical protein
MTSEPYAIMLCLTGLSAVPVSCAIFCPTSQPEMGEGGVHWGVDRDPGSLCMSLKNLSALPPPKAPRSSGPMHSSPSLTPPPLSGLKGSVLV